MTGPGDERRAAVLERAVHIASLEGLEGLTLGRLSLDTGFQKSALQSLFGTKEQLQLAIVAHAVDVFDRAVLQVTEDEPDGLPRVQRLMDAWIDYLPTFEGGCLFVASASELDGRPGPVRDAIARAVEAGLKLLIRQLDLARRLGELSADVDVEQLAFGLHAMLLKANHDRQLLARGDALDRGRRAIDGLLAAAGASQR